MFAFGCSCVYGYVTDSYCFGYGCGCGFCFWLRVLLRFLLCVVAMLLLWLKLWMWLWLLLWLFASRGLYVCACELLAALPSRAAQESQRAHACILTVFGVRCSVLRSTVRFSVSSANGHG